jgi:hypothetical protein
MDRRPGIAVAVVCAVHMSTKEDQIDIVISLSESTRFELSTGTRGQVAIQLACI